MCYPAIVEQGNDEFYISFPDVPGCVSYGKTMEQLAANAEEALAFHFAGMIEDGDALPEPSNFDANSFPPIRTMIIRTEVPVHYLAR
jgi:predicted RNase H-like HicB family nuclease